MGRDLLERIGINLLYSTGYIRRGDINVPMILMDHFSENISRHKLFGNARNLRATDRKTLFRK